MEGLHRQFRKVTKTKTNISNRQFTRKDFIFSIMNVVKK
ncbi:hypothetical protein [Acetivibrio clariflavus]